MSNSRVIVITGVTRGLGRAMVSQFAGLGHIVVGCGRAESAIAALAAELPLVFKFNRY